MDHEGGDHGQHHGEHHQAKQPARPAVVEAQRLARPGRAPEVVRGASTSRLPDALVGPGAGGDERQLRDGEPAQRFAANAELGAGLVGPHVVLLGMSYCLEGVHFPPSPFTWL